MGMIIQNGKVFSGEPKTTYKEKILWSGSETPYTSPGTNITLLDNLYSYDEIVFETYNSSYNQHAIIPFTTSLISIGITYMSIVNTVIGLGVCFTVNSGNSIKITRISSGSETDLTYTKVVGIKYGDTVKRKDYHVYSTDEWVVGTWIDGSTLYEKTYSYSISSETSQEIATLDSNIVVKEIKGIIHNNGNDMTIPWIDALFFYNVYNSPAHKLTAIKKNTGDWTGQAAEITIRYTKSSI